MQMHREKKRRLHYTAENAIVDALQEDLKELISVSIRAYRELSGQKSEEVDVDVSFGEYANPSFESQVETVGKGRSQGVMSVEACVDELYGDSRDDEWKKQEVARLKAEQGIMEVEDPAVNTAAGDFQIGESNGSNNNEPLIQNEPTGDEKVPKTDE